MKLFNCLYRIRYLVLKLFLFLPNFLSGQFHLGTLDSIGDFQLLPDSVASSIMLSDERYVDSLIVKKLSFLNTQEEMDSLLLFKHRDEVGGYYCQYTINNGKVDSLVLRGINKSVDSIMQVFSSSAFEILLSNLNLENHPKLSVIIPIRFIRDSRSDTAYIPPEGNNNHYRIVKRDFEAFYLSPIPREESIDINRAHQIIDKLLDHNTKSWIKKESVDYFLHKFSFMKKEMIREWELSEKSELKSFFKRKGVRDSDEMASLILRSYYYYLKGQVYSIEGKEIID